MDYYLISMRDPNRIYKFQNMVTSLWAMNPDMRYLQLVEMVHRKTTEMFGLNPETDPFYIEDDKTEAAISALLKGQ